MYNIGYGFNTTKEKYMFDVIIVGAGVVGCATARELSRYNLKVLVLEKGHDVCSGATKAGGGMIHAGFDPTPGTNKAKYNVAGCPLIYKTCEELDVPYLNNGTTVFATDPHGMDEIRKLKATGDINGVHTDIIEPPKLYEMQPHIGKEVCGILWAPSGGVTDPFTFTFALAENAATNGVEFLRNTEVTNIIKTKDSFQITAVDHSENSHDKNGTITFSTKLVINCAGTCADTINNMVSKNKIKIIPRYGAHVVIDKKLAKRLNTTLIETPHDLPGGGHTKGQAIIPTLGGTMIAGCDATVMEDPDHTAVLNVSLSEVLGYFREMWHVLPFEGDRFPEEHIISMFGGCRPHPENNDFIIGEAEDVPGFINAAGIESPGFTSSIAIAQDLRDLVTDKLNPDFNPKFNPHRKAKPAFRNMTNDERVAAIKEDPDYSHVVCRCEMVTEAEIRDAIRRPVGARSVSAIKMRTRAGMGRCQGGFCGTRVLEILSEELGIDPLEVTQCGENSEILMAHGCMEE